MPEPKAVGFTIDEEGNIQLEGQRFQGAECDKHIRALTAALGTVTGIKHKPEFVQHSTRQQQTH
jgi:hypothetical protein